MWKVLLTRFARAILVRQHAYACLLLCLSLRQLSDRGDALIEDACCFIEPKLLLEGCVALLHISRSLLHCFRFLSLLHNNVAA